MLGSSAMDLAGRSKGSGGSHSEPDSCPGWHGTRLLLLQPPRWFGLAPYRRETPLSIGRQSRAFPEICAEPCRGGWRTIRGAGPWRRGLGARIDDPAEPCEPGCRNRPKASLLNLAVSLSSGVRPGLGAIAAANAHERHFALQGSAWPPSEAMTPAAMRTTTRIRTSFAIARCESVQS